MVMHQSVSFYVPSLLSVMRNKMKIVILSIAVCAILAVPDDERRVHIYGTNQVQFSHPQPANYHYPQPHYDSQQIYPAVFHAAQQQHGSFSEQYLVTAIKHDPAPPVVQFQRPSYKPDDPFNGQSYIIEPSYVLKPYRPETTYHAQPYRPAPYPPSYPAPAYPVFQIPPPTYPALFQSPAYQPFAGPSSVTIVEPTQTNAPVQSTVSSVQPVVKTVVVEEKTDVTKVKWSDILSADANELGQKYADKQKREKDDKESEESEEDDGEKRTSQESDSEVKKQDNKKGSQEENHSENVTEPISYPIPANLTSKAVWKIPKTIASYVQSAFGSVPNSSIESDSDRSGDAPTEKTNSYSKKSENEESRDKSTLTDGADNKERSEAADQVKVSLLAKNEGRTSQVEVPSSSETPEDNNESGVIELVTLLQQEKPKSGSSVYYEQGPENVEQQLKTNEEENKVLRQPIITEAPNSVRIDSEEDQTGTETTPSIHQVNELLTQIINYKVGSYQQPTEIENPYAAIENNEKPDVGIEVSKTLVTEEAHQNTAQLIYLLGNEFSNREKSLDDIDETTADAAVEVTSEREDPLYRQDPVEKTEPVASLPYKDEIEGKSPNAVTPEVAIESERPAYLRPYTPVVPKIYRPRVKIEPAAPLLHRDESKELNDAVTPEIQTETIANVTPYVPVVPKIFRPKIEISPAASLSDSRGESKELVNGVPTPADISIETESPANVTPYTPVIPKIFRPKIETEIVAPLPDRDESKELYTVTPEIQTESPSNERKERPGAVTPEEAIETERPAYLRPYKPVVPKLFRPRVKIEPVASLPDRDQSKELNDALTPEIQTETITNVTAYVPVVPKIFRPKIETLPVVPLPDRDESKELYTVTPEIQTESPSNNPASYKRVVQKLFRPKVESDEVESPETGFGERIKAFTKFALAVQKARFEHDISHKLFEPVLPTEPISWEPSTQHLSEEVTLTENNKSESVSAKKTSSQKPIVNYVLVQVNKPASEYYPTEAPVVEATLFYRKPEDPKSNEASTRPTVPLPALPEFSTESSYKFQQLFYGQTAHKFTPPPRSPPDETIIEGPPTVESAKYEEPSLVQSVETGYAGRIVAEKMSPDEPVQVINAFHHLVYTSGPSVDVAHPVNCTNQVLPVVKQPVLNSDPIEIENETATQRMNTASADIPGDYYVESSTPLSYTYEQNAYVTSTYAFIEEGGLSAEYQKEIAAAAQKEVESVAKILQVSPYYQTEKPDDSQEKTYSTEGAIASKDPWYSEIAYVPVIDSLPYEAVGITKVTSAEEVGSVDVTTPKIKSAEIESIYQKKTYNPAYDANTAADEAPKPEHDVSSEAPVTDRYETTEYSLVSLTQQLIPADVESLYEIHSSTPEYPESTTFESVLQVGDSSSESKEIVKNQQPEEPTKSIAPLPCHDKMVDHISKVIFNTAALAVNVPFNSDGESSGEDSSTITPTTVLPDLTTVTYNESILVATSTVAPNGYKYVFKSRPTPNRFYESRSTTPSTNSTTKEPPTTRRPFVVIGKPIEMRKPINGRIYSRISPVPQRKPQTLAQIKILPTRLRSSTSTIQLPNRRFFISRALMTNDKKKTNESKEDGEKKDA